MINFLLRAIVAAAGLWLAAAIVPGVHVRGPVALAGAALLLGMVNALVRPILVLVTLPLTLVTFGLFLLVINAALLGLVATMIPGFSVEGFWPALWASVVVGAASLAASTLTEPNFERERTSARPKIRARD